MEQKKKKSFIALFHLIGRTPLNIANIQIEIKFDSISQKKAQEKVCEKKNSYRIGRQKK